MEIARRDPDLAPGLAPLIEELAAAREARDDGLLAVLDETLPHLQQDFADLLRDKPKRRADVWKMRLWVLGRQAIKKRLTAAFELEEAARGPEASAEFHLMRIAIKKLKYAVEPFLGILGKAGRRAHKPISRLQDLMGEVHDCDVLLGVIEEARGGALELPAADSVGALVARDRDCLHGETMALLDKLSRKQVREKLLAALR